MKKIYLLLLFSSINITFSQFVPEWVQIQSQTNLNIDNSNLSAMDAAGNIYVSNVIFDNGIIDVVLSKFNNTGIFEWQRQFNSSGPDNQDFPVKVIIDQAGNILVAGNGNSASYMDSKAFILKYNPSGDLLNSIEYKRSGSPITILTNITFDLAGNYFITGQVADFQTFIDSALVIKFNPALSIQWSRTSRDTNYNENFARGLKTDPAGNIFVSGISGRNIINIKYDNSGNLLWFKKFYNQFPPYVNHLSPVSVLDSAQNLYVSESLLDINGDDTSKTLLLKYNPSGVLLWSAVYNISNIGSERTTNIFTDNSNIYMHVNYYDNSYLVKVNTTGQQQWVKTMDHYIYTMNFDNANNIITTGYKNAYLRKEMCMEKFNSSGTPVASYTFSYDGTGFDQATTFFNTNDSKIILGGYHNSSLMFVKLTPSNSRLFTFSRINLSKPILDNQYTYDTISLSTMQLPPFSQVKNVYINFDTILHTATGDLNIMLVHDGRTDTLIYQRGGIFDNFIGTKLSDTSLTSICASGNSPFTGHYSPCKPLNQLNNLSATGNWILKIYDRRSPDTGSLEAWTITVAYEIPIGINQISSEIPYKFYLMQNYPNPFNPVTKIKFSLPRSSYTKIIVYDILGNEISTLVGSKLSAGVYDTEFNASNLSSGIYFYKLITDDFTETKKMVLIK